MREHKQALCSTTAERTRWGEVSTKELYGGDLTTGLLSTVNNSSGLAALMVQAEPESDFFAPTLSKFIRSRVLLLAPHYLPSVVCSKVLPLHPLHHYGNASETNLCAFLQHLMSPLLPLHLMARLSASKHRALLSILTVIMATEPLDDPTPLSFDNFLSVTALAAMYNNPLPEPKPHPEQGGVRISSEYLDQISEAECIWHVQ